MLFTVNSSFAQMKCSHLFEHRQSETQFEDIIGAKSNHFDPKPYYVEAFSQALRTLKPKIGNFSEMNLKLRDIRIQIAKKNSKDKDLYVFMKSTSSKDHFEGKLHDKSNVTDLYAEYEYQSATSRYKDLYMKVLNIYDRGGFTDPPVNEYSLRLKKQAGHRAVESDTHWLLNYETLHGEKKPMLVSAIVAKTNFAVDKKTPLFGVFNSFSRDIPRIKKHMEYLWDKTLSSKTERAEKAKAIAEFEWFYFQSNPWGRAAASIGDILSLSLQNETGLTIRKEFVHLDFDALTLGKDEYVDWRAPQMLK